VVISADIVQIMADGAALAVGFDLSVVTARAEIVSDVDLATGPRDVTQVIFALASPARAVSVRLVLTPSGN
jgi:hypothetical protein